ncbi:MAG: hypothetical protein HQK83_09540 [Fibrobacteria bacterium]|nr:hypothetical protein [Fibrobacteria bacterium]
MKYTRLSILVPVLLIGIQFFSILLNLRAATSHYGLYNRDAFSYHIQWSQASRNLNIFSEPVLVDPDHDMIRLLGSFPPLIFAATNKYFNPFLTYAIWCCISILVIWWSLIAFSKALGFKGNTAVMVSLAYYAMGDLLAQLPPLSLNQVMFILDIFLLKPETIVHFGAFQYPHTFFFYPMFYGLLAMLIVGIRNIKDNIEISRTGLLFWTSLCLLLPVNYLYHWITMGVVIGSVLITGMSLKWWNLKKLLKYKSVIIALFIILVVWIAVFVFQNVQLSNEAGRFFSLSNGLTESRFILFPTGLVIRIIFWVFILIYFVKFKPESILPSLYLIICFLMLNMQLITGKNIQPGHWTLGVQKMFAWCLIISICFILIPFIKKRFPVFRTKQRWLFTSGIVLLLFFVSIRSYASWHLFTRKSEMDSNRFELITFLKDLPMGVVLSPELDLETDVLLHTSQKTFLPRAQQSAVSHKECIERLAQAAFILGYSKQGFYDWLHIKGQRFFGVLYGTNKEFSSSLFYDPKTKGGVLEYQKGVMPIWDEEIIQTYQASPEPGKWKLDYLVLFKEEVAKDPLCAHGGNVLFENQTYTVLEAPPLVSWKKVWCSEVPYIKKIK